jgi:hypothetical protein
MYTFKEKMVASMEEVFVAFKHMQQNNHIVHDSIAHLQFVQT